LDRPARVDLVAPAWSLRPAGAADLVEPPARLGRLAPV